MTTTTNDTIATLKQAHKESSAFLAKVHEKNPDTFPTIKELAPVETVERRVKNFSKAVKQSKVAQTIVVEYHELNIGRSSYLITQVKNGFTLSPNEWLGDVHLAKLIHDGVNVTIKKKK